MMKSIDHSSLSCEQQIGLIHSFNFNVLSTVATPTIEHDFFASWGHSHFWECPVGRSQDLYLANNIGNETIASVPGLPCSVHVLIIRLERGRPGTRGRPGRLEPTEATCHCSNIFMFLCSLHVVQLMLYREMVWTKQCSGLVVRGYCISCRLIATYSLLCFTMSMKAHGPQHSILIIILLIIILLL